MNDTSTIELQAVRMTGIVSGDFRVGEVCNFRLSTFAYRHFVASIHVVGHQVVINTNATEIKDSIKYAEPIFVMPESEAK
jgi:hypothetical protein